MATSDERIENLEGKYSDLHTVVNVLANKVDNLANELQDFKNEMRDRDNRRADEIATTNAKYDAEVKAINAKIDDKFERLLNQLQNMAIAAVVGVGAVVAAVVSIMKP